MNGGASANSSLGAFGHPRSGGSHRRLEESFHARHLLDGDPQERVQHGQRGIALDQRLPGRRRIGHRIAGLHERREIEVLVLQRMGQLVDEHHVLGALRLDSRPRPRGPPERRPRGGPGSGPSPPGRNSPRSAGSAAGGETQPGRASRESARTPSRELSKERRAPAGMSSRKDSATSCASSFSATVLDWTGRFAGRPRQVSACRCSSSRWSLTPGPSPASARGEHSKDNRAAAEPHRSESRAFHPSPACGRGPGVRVNSSSS